MIEGLDLFSRFELPWSFPCNPQASQHSAASEERASLHGLLDSAQDRHRFAAFVSLDSHVYPGASLAALSVVGGFNQWLYFLDDQYDDHPNTHQDLGRIQQIMQEGYDVLQGATPGRPDSPFLAFTRDLCRDINLLAPPGFLGRFLPNVKEYLFEGSMVGLGHWVRKETLKLDDYIELRSLDSGVAPVLDCIEIASGLPLPAEVLENPLIKELTRLAIRHVALANDIFSYEKEVLWHGSTVNLVHVLLVHEQHSLTDAVTRAVDLVNGFGRAFIKLEQQLPTFSGPGQRAAQAYIMGMKSWMRGHIDFSMRSHRFRSDRSPFAELRSSEAPPLSH